MTTLEQLTDDELLVLAQECRGEVLHEDRPARGDARDLEVEVRRRFAGATTVSASLGADLDHAATQSRWRELLGRAAASCRRIGSS
jgi:hypothetical protein